jgi:hypothetical protein
MDERLHLIRNWANRGTMNQLYSEISAKLAKSEYRAELQGDQLRFYRTTKSGGFLGIGAKVEKALVLEVIREGEDLRIPAETADPAFVEYIMPMLRAH